MRQFILLLLISASSFAQDFRLITPNIDNLKNELEQTGFPDDPAYIYLKQNYKTTSEPYDVLRDFEFQDRPLCAMLQDFEHGIKYMYSSCGEAKGTVLLVTLPKANLDNVRKWIESMHQLYSSYDENVWTGMRYHPHDEGAGCHYEIVQEKRTT